ncbi:MAG TPA: hypothetical protein VLA19_12145 [Herpetosiphonaceae bacterium]|nr:hypothetical protein [Herpetosiphonaceae bacterium]
MLEERCADATQVARTALRREPRRAQFQKVACLWLAREHFIDGQQHLIWLQLWSEVAQVLDWTTRLGTSGGQHALPVGPRHTVRRTHLFTRQGSVDRCVQFRRPPSSTPWLLSGHKVQLQAREIIPYGQRDNLCLLSLPNELTMRAYQAADRRVGEQIIVVGLPAEQAGNRDKGQVLRQQTGPFL